MVVLSDVCKLLRLSRILNGSCFRSLHSELRSVEREAQLREERGQLTTRARESF